MYNAATLLDVHTRAHESLRRLIAFCGTLTNDELSRPLAGFGFPTILGQLEHTIGAELYWQTVVTRGYSEEATMPDLPDIAALEAFREQTASVTRAYLNRAGDRCWRCAAQSANPTPRTTWITRSIEEWMPWTPTGPAR